MFSKRILYLTLGFLLDHSVMENKTIVLNKENHPRLWLAFSDWCFTYNVRRGNTFIEKLYQLMDSMKCTTKINGETYFVNSLFDVNP